MDDVILQIQLVNGSWVDAMTVPNTPSMILSNMKILQMTNPGRRIRAVSPNGAIIDIL